MKGFIHEAYSLLENESLVEGKTNYSNKLVFNKFGDVIQVNTLFCREMFTTEFVEKLLDSKTRISRKPTNSSKTKGTAEEGKHVHHIFLSRKGEYDEKTVEITPQAHTGVHNNLAKNLADEINKNKVLLSLITEAYKNCNYNKFDSDGYTTSSINLDNKQKGLVLNILSQVGVEDVDIDLLLQTQETQDYIQNNSERYKVKDEDFEKRNRQFQNELLDLLMDKKHNGAFIQFLDALSRSAIVAIKPYVENVDDIGKITR